MTLHYTARHLLAAAGSRAVSRQVASQPRLQRRAVVAGGEGHLDPRRQPQARHGGGARVVQERHRCRQHMYVNRVTWSIVAFHNRSTRN